MYRDARAEYGASGPLNLATFAWSYPADDPGRAWEDCAAHATYRARNYADWYGTAADLPSDRTWMSAVEAGQNPGARASLFKTPDAALEDLRSMAALGITSVLYFATFPGMRPSATLPYFETMAREVLPAARGL
jgi:hypothetical protein